MFFRILDRNVISNKKKCSQEIRSDLVLAINVYLMLIFTKQNVGKILQEPRKHEKCNH